MKFYKNLPTFPSLITVFIKRKRRNHTKEYKSGDIPDPEKAGMP